MSLLSRTAVAVALGSALFATGCGPNCQSTCNKLFLAEPDGCGLAVPGKPLEESSKDCLDECDGALNKVGDVGDYNPFDPDNAGSSPVLENELQAALWMDCVEQHSCQDLGEGFCAPTGF